MLIIETIKNKTDLENHLFNIISKYTYKYIYRIYNKQLQENGISKSLYVDFQLKLLKIAEWSEATVEKEYNKFLKWCKKKYNLKESNINKLLENIIVLSTKVLVNKSNIYIESILENHEFLKLNVFYYKYLKKVSRFFYENPKLINDGIPPNTKKNMISLINDNLPMKQITNIIEYSNKSRLCNESTPIDNDNDNDIDNDNDNDSIFTNYKIKNVNTEIKTNLIINKSDSMSEQSLKYVSSEDFQNEYFNEDGEDGDNKDKVKDVLSDKDPENVIKHINLPKYKKNPFFYNKKKINEINENFFDN
jgi:hypothetical protein